MSRAAYLLLCFVFINSPDKGFLIFAVGILTANLANIAGFVVINKQVFLKLPSPAESFGALRSGSSMFLFVGITSIYTTLNLVILGLSQTASIVAAYGTSDRIVRAAGGLLDPLNRVVFAKISYLYHHDFEKGIKFLKIAAVIIFISGCGIFIGGEYFSKFIIHILTPNYPEATQYLRLLFLFIPVLAMNNIVGLHIMIPLGLDREFNIVFLITSILGVGAMLVLTPKYGAIGMGTITIATELVACIGMGFMTFKNGRLSMRYKPENSNV